MKKTILVLMGLLLFSLTVNAEDQYVEDFESYNYNAIYNAEALTVSYEGVADVTLTESSSYIINGLGGILYSEEEAYTANAAENIFCYTKTGEGTATAVFGGLQNGWHGMYSNPPTSLDSKGGASGELNQYNRRLAVVPLSGNSVLKMNPAKNSYVSTFTIYAKDDLEFYDNTKWTTDVYIDSINANGYCTISLTKGKLNNANPFSGVGSVENGREILNDILKFDNDGNITFFDGSTVEYTKKKWYTVELLLKASDRKTLCVVNVIDKDSGEVLYSNSNIEIEMNLKDEDMGMGYCTYTQQNSDASCVYLDNVSVEKVDLYATLATTREVNINGRGNVAIKFNSAYLPESIDTSTVKVYCGNAEVEGCDVSTLSQNRVKIDLPVLKPSTVYTIKIEGVIGENGVSSKCEIPFKTISYGTISNTAINGNGITFKVKNNSVEDIQSLYLVAVCEDENNMIQGLYYKKVPLLSEQTLPCEFTEIVTQGTTNVYVYAVQNLLDCLSPLSDFVKISNN